MATDHDALAQWSMRQWSQLHDGYDVDRSVLLRAWLRMMHVLAAPITRAGITPTTVTSVGVCAAGAAVRAARVGAPALMAASLVLATAICDGLDGAVALQRRGAGRPTSRHGAAIDHTADRVTDVLFVAALARAHASRRSAAAAAVATIGYEAVRSLARRSGRVGALVTIGERPIRVGVVCIGLVATPTGGAATIALLTAGASAQVMRRARR